MDALRGKGFNRKGTQRISQRNAKLQIVEVLYFGQAIHEVTRSGSSCRLVSCDFVDRFWPIEESIKSESGRE
jgi:hypothetical protein